MNRYMNISMDITLPISARQLVGVLAAYARITRSRKAA